jgi:hypothetical protein
MDEEVTNVQNKGTISGAMIVLMLSTSTAPASDVWVQQAHGRLPGGTPAAEENKPVKAAPEGGATSAATGSPVTPATCNQQNASSPACYSATQQTKGK